MPEVVVRRAVPADASGIGRVRVEAWREAYTGRMPQSILDGMDVEQATEFWRSVIAGDPPYDEGETWVAEVDGAIGGFASSGPSADEGAVAGRPHLYALYVLAEHYGSGAGQMLLDAAIGTAAATLWILEDNPRARAFYVRNGFRPDGIVKDDDQWGDPVREVRMVRPEQPELSGSGSPD
ncbi:GNAT family N-acetyltransferase [Microbacterium pumilum]|uniref:GNAT family N-acetyltransferase n=1 Tax=Microbacterium pumilum TaxID=344165 RepID=A0ABP5DPW7_9MICO